MGRLYQMEHPWVRSMPLCIGYTLVNVLWFGLFACRPWLICVIPAHCGRCSERLISALEEANIRSWHTAPQHTLKLNTTIYTALLNIRSEHTAAIFYLREAKRSVYCGVVVTRDKIPISDDAGFQRDCVAVCAISSNWLYCAVMFNVSSDPVILEK